MPPVKDVMGLNDLYESPIDLSNLKNLQLIKKWRYRHFLFYNNV